MAIIGIDSLDPHLILKHRARLPNLSQLIDESPTFIARSVWPVDTIPAWVSIYTGLRPSNHGLLYVYDVFDQSLSDLAKLDITPIKGRTFWDYAGQEGCRTVIIAPTLMYPAWKLNGIMVSKSPFETRVDWLRTTRAVSVCPEAIQEKYAIPKELPDLWGGFPGIKHLKEWATFRQDSTRDRKRPRIETIQRRGSGTCSSSSFPSWILYNTDSGGFSMKMIQRTPARIRAVTSSRTTTSIRFYYRRV